MQPLPKVITLVDTGFDERTAATMGTIAEALEARGHEVRKLAVPRSGLPRRAAKASKRLWRRFKATPAALVESWRVARHLATAFGPGDAVVVSDRGGLGGMFALEQAMLPAESRSVVLVTAANATALEYLAVTGTISGLPAELDHEVDWELTGYRFSAAVLATSQRAVALLAGLGIDAQLAVSPEPPVTARPPIGTSIFLPEPVSRLARTPTALRGLSGLLDRRPDARFTVSSEDRDDIIFDGSTWQSLAGVRSMLGDALERGHVAKPDIVVLGDPFAVPEDHLRGLRADGVPMVVAAGSVASALWPDAPTWATEADVVNAIVEPVPPPAAELREPKLRATRPAPGRAQRVSVGIPVFRNHVYLDACVASILAQEQQPAEIVIVDDGSRSAEAEAAIARWCDAHPGLIRSLRQPNRGVCAARNLALEAMTGDAFVLVDADDELDPDFISACATALRADGSLSAVATWTEFHGTYEGIEAKPPFDARVGRRENPIISTCVLVDMAVRDEGIRFTPDLAFLYCEDWDLWAQIVAAGGRFGLVPRPLARHRVHPESGGFQRTAVAHAVGKARATERLAGL